MSGFISGFVLSTLKPVTEVLAELFKYNRENFAEDREQRMTMEYQAMDMKVEQTDLWRDDVKDLMEFSLEKLEVYLLVSTLELGFCVTAYVKSRVPAGGPAWLICAHNISLTAAFMYLLFSLWLGMHAYVASVAYKVRILTHHIRLPIPTWSALEAARTYSSAYEKMRPTQMFRVPILMPQDKVAAADASLNQLKVERLAQQHGNRASSYVHEGASGTTLPDATDPWGLERSGSASIELAPDVNSDTAKQRHVWLAREAASFYQTHEAFSRVTLTLGTSYLAQFMCYFCLSYTMLTNAATVPALCGVVAFSAISLGMLWLDLSESKGNMIFLSVLNFLGPLISTMVAFMTAKYDGYPGWWEWLTPVALLSHGLWILSYLAFLRIRETEFGAILPFGFRGILYIDVFGRFKHTEKTPDKFSKPLSQQPYRTQSVTKNLKTFRNPYEHEDLPAMLNFERGPERAEDVGESRYMHDLLHASVKGAAVLRLRPDSFAQSAEDDEDVTPDRKAAKRHYGGGAAQVFTTSTLCLSVVYILAALVSVWAAGVGYDNVGVYGHPFNGLDFITVDVSHEISTGRAHRIETVWPAALARPRGLTCDAQGRVFAVAGQGADGRKALLHGRLSSAPHPTSTASTIQSRGGLRHAAPAARSYRLQFEAADRCPHAESANGLAIQDLALHGCSHGQDCVALVLPRQGHHLATCALKSSNATADLPQKSSRMQVARSWLEEGASSDTTSNSVSSAEELTSLAVVPCSEDDHDVHSMADRSSECAVVGTSSHRAARLALSQGLDPEPVWAPRQMLSEAREVSGVGVFAHLGNGYLGVLQRKSNSLQLLDLANGGAKAGVVRLPASPRKASWAAVCAGGGHIYAMEAGEDRKSVV